MNRTIIMLFCFASAVLLLASQVQRPDRGAATAAQRVTEDGVIEQGAPVNDEPEETAPQAETVGDRSTENSRADGPQVARGERSEAQIADAEINAEIDVVDGAEVSAVSDLSRQPSGSLLPDRLVKQWRSLMEPFQPQMLPLPSALEISLAPIAAAHIPRYLVVDLSDRRVYLYEGDQIQADYPVAIGKEGWETPTGTFQITHLTENPNWRHPVTGELVPAGSDSPVGTRWIKFWQENRNAIGFHGTNEDEAIGQAVSHGCLRMHNTDIEALFAAVHLGMPVTVQP